MIRLDKLLAHANYGTRKEVKELIRKGNVLVNGEVIRDDDYKVDEVNDEVTIFDMNIDYQEFRYYLLNKPQDYVSATFDYNKPIVLDLIDDYKNDLFPVGRLDIDTEGLLLITNDGKLAHKLLSPKSHVDKKYYLKYDGKIPKNICEQFKNGIVIDDGYKCLPGEFIDLGNNEANIIIREGKFHQVKRMMEAVGCTVTYLKRIEFGPIRLDDDLKLGDYRDLTEEEIKSLKEN